MCVAVIDFIVCRIADVNDRDIKVQSLGLLAFGALDDAAGFIR